LFDRVKHIITKHSLAQKPSTNFSIVNIKHCMGMKMFIQTTCCRTGHISLCKDYIHRSWSRMLSTIVCNRISFISITLLTAQQLWSEFGNYYRQRTKHIVIKHMKKLV